MTAEVVSLRICVHRNLRRMMIQMADGPPVPARVSCSLPARPSSSKRLLAPRPRAPGHRTRQGPASRRHTCGATPRIGPSACFAASPRIYATLPAAGHDIADLNVAVITALPFCRDLDVVRAVLEAAVVWPRPYREPKAESPSETCVLSTKGRAVLLWV